MAMMFPGFISFLGGLCMYGLISLNKIKITWPNAALIIGAAWLPAVAVWWVTKHGA